METSHGLFTSPLLPSSRCLSLVLEWSPILWIPAKAHVHYELDPPLGAQASSFLTSSEADIESDEEISMKSLGIGKSFALHLGAEALLGQHLSQLRHQNAT